MKGGSKNITSSLIILSAVTLGLFGFLFQMAFAQSGPVGGIVPCGYDPLPPCDLCKLYTLAKNGIDFMLFDLILPIAIIALLIGGIFLLTSRGNPQMMETGKKAIANTVVGVLIAFGAWLVIATIVNTLGYGGFTGAWNEAPICAPSEAGTGGGETVKQFCVKPSPTPGVPATCEDKGTEEACISGCAGGTCETSCPRPPGSCPTVQNGPCSEGSLSSSCFGSSLAHEASQICMGESGGNRLKAGDYINISGTSEKIPRSIGLFQINLSAHSINGLNCPSAFEGENKPLKNTAEARLLYTKCVAAAHDADVNITKACELRSKAGNWRTDWRNVANGCGIP